MPKNPKLPEAELHAMIVRDAKMRLGCKDFTPKFSLRELREPTSNWEVVNVRDAEGWATECAQAFKEAVARARRKFDVAWPFGD